MATLYFEAGGANDAKFPCAVNWITSRKILTAALVLSGSLVTHTASALDPAQIGDELKRPIIGPDLSLAEVQTFTESRVPPVPKITDRDEWNRYANEMRRQVLDRIVYRGAAVEWRDAETKVEWLDVMEGGPEYRIRKLRYEALPGLWIPALLYEPTKPDGRVPVVMNVNGHERRLGKAADYKQIRCINQAKRGMIALNVEWLGMGQLQQGFNHSTMNQLDLCGTSGLAPFYLTMKRGLDLLLAHEHADPSRVAVAGLSGGGWQTIVIGALDTRVTLSNPVAGYSSFKTRARHLKDLGDSEQTPSDLATVADYTHLTALLAPRPALLTYNEKDNCCFESPYALPPLLEAAEPVYALLDAPDRIRSHVNTDPGTHNFERDNREALYRMFREYFYAGSEDFPAREIECGDELKTYDQLGVPLPSDNRTFNRLASELARSLPVNPTLPTDTGGAWQKRRRERLSQLVRYHRLECDAHEHDSRKLGEVTVRHWRVRIGDSWTVPAVEFSPADPRTTTILVNDEGRAASGDEVARLLGEGSRVLAVDPFYFGESRIAQRGYLFALLVAAVGQRPLGIQAGQLAALARWMRGRFPDQALTLSATGPRSCTFALVTAAVEPEAVQGVELTGSLSSLKEIIAQDRNVQQMPEMFCFGLLREFDVLQLAAVVTPRPVTFRDADDELKQHLRVLTKVYQLYESEHRPFVDSGTESGDQ